MHVGVHALAHVAKICPPVHVGTGACLTHIHVCVIIRCHRPCGTVGHAAFVSAVSVWYVQEVTVWQSRRSVSYAHEKGPLWWFVVMNLPVL